MEDVEHPWEWQVVIRCRNWLRPVRLDYKSGGTPNARATLPDGRVADYTAAGLADAVAIAMRMTAGE